MAENIFLQTVPKPPLHFIQGKNRPCWLHTRIPKGNFPWKWSETWGLLSYQLSYLDNLYLFSNKEIKLWPTLYKCFCFYLNVFKTILIMQFTFFKFNYEINYDPISSHITRWTSMYFRWYVHHQLKSTALKS
jgi:hypothetical protein